MHNFSGLGNVLKFENRFPLLITSVLYLAVTFLTFNQIEEDAFIYFRLADNIANGHGYVFNPFGERIESGSGPLWLALMVVIGKLSLNIVIGAKLVGVLFGILSLYLLTAISNRVICQDLKVFPALLLCVSIPFYCWSQRAMETPLYVFSLLLFCYMLLNEKFRDRSWMAALLILLCRPESLFVLLSILLFLAILDREKVLPVRKLIAYVILFQLILTLIRFWYFNDLLPHSYYHKIRSSVNFSPLVLFAKENYLVFLVIPAIIGWMKTLREKGSVSITECVILAILVPTMFWPIIGEDQKPYNRHLVPALPFLYLWCILNIERLVKKENVIVFLQLGLFILVFASY